MGRATAELFAREGAAVVIAGRDAEKGQRAAADIIERGGSAYFVRCDVRSADDCQHAVEATLELFGRLDILFNNAGVVLGGRAEDTDEETWDRVMDTNVKGVFLMSRAAVPIMRAQGGGAIVNNSSDAGLVGEANLVAYCASKGAAVLLTKAMAVDHAAEGIRINAICPGPVYVDRWDRRAKGAGRDVADDIAAFASDVPMDRVGSPDEIPEAVLFLASDASSFVTGTTLVLDGGRTAK
jgi:NAD(P)-dependent dehydrogenase (short-subunit alcohol dehydrogenase family)